MRMRPGKRAQERLKLLAAVLAVPLILFVLPVRFTAPMRIVFTEAVGPVDQAAFRAGGDVLATTGTLSDMFLRREQERALGTELERLRNQLIAAAEKLRAQQRRLQSIEGLHISEPSYSVLSAAVTGYDSVPSHRSVTIDAGRSDGVRGGMAVCAAGALAGTVTEAGPWRSRVRLITDAGSAIACRVSRTRRLCILQGTGGDELHVEWLDRNSDVRIGDLLVTARLADVGAPRNALPAGLPAAAVVRVERNANAPLFLSVRAVPRANLGRLEWGDVLVPDSDDSSG